MSIYRIQSDELRKKIHRRKKAVIGIAEQEAVETAIEKATYMNIQLL